MPPQTEELLVSTRFDESASPASPASFRRNILPAKDSVPFLDLQQPLLSTTAVASEERKNDQRAECFHLTIQTIQTRVASLLAELDDYRGSPVRDACRLSLQTRMRLALDQAGVLIESYEKSESASEAMIAKLRTTFSLVAAVQYLDTVESAMRLADSTSNASGISLDNQLSEVIPPMGGSDDDGGLAFPSLRVSHWVAPVLAFDLSAGETTHKTIVGDESDGSLPLSIDIVPVVTFKSQELIGNARPSKFSFQQFDVEIQKCTHTPQEFSEGAGTLGVAFVRAHLSLVDEGNNNKADRIWGESEGERLRIAEAKVVQLNAYPPKPRAFIDLYTSSVYGDTGVSVTMLIKTSVTKSQESPKLAIELFVAPS